MKTRFDSGLAKTPITMVRRMPNRVTDQAPTEIPTSEATTP
jgi:hypothetical protein